MTNTRTQGCECITWARVPPDKLPMSEHAKGCNMYKEERFVKVTFDGSSAIMEPHEGDAYEDSDAIKEDVFMTSDQFERLPEFEGF